MSNLVSHLKKAAVAAVAVTAISAGTTVATTSAAEAQWRPRGAWGGPGFRPGVRPAYGYGYRPFRGGRGVGVAAGIIGGLAAGALIAGATQPAYAVPPTSYGYVPSYSYGYASPGYYQPAYESYQPTCYTRRVRQVVDYDTVVIRRVRVCE